MKISGWAEKAVQRDVVPARGAPTTKRFGQSKWGTAAHSARLLDTNTRSLIEHVFACDRLHPHSRLRVARRHARHARARAAARGSLAAPWDGAAARARHGYGRGGGSAPGDAHGRGAGNVPAARAGRAGSRDGARGGGGGGAAER